MNKQTFVKLMALGFTLEEALAMVETPTAAQPTGSKPDAESDDYAPVFPMLAGAAASNAKPANGDEPERKRRRRRYKARVAYVLTTVGRNAINGKASKAVRESIDELNPSVAETLAAIVKHAAKHDNAPLTNRDIEKLAGQKQKTVESSVYKLRTMEPEPLIKSIPRD